MIEKSISISEQIIKASNEIWKNTKASKDNWILASPKVFSYIKYGWAYRNLTLRDFIDAQNPGYRRK